MSTIRQKAAEGLRVGDTFIVSRRFSEQDVNRFADISRDYNPIHFDLRYARAKSFGDCICHGLLVASMLTEVGGQIGWLASGMNFKFRKPVFIGDVITCKLTIAQMDDRGWSKADASFTNQDGTLVLEAELFGIVPGSDEQAVLRAMLAEGDPTNKLRD